MKKKNLIILLIFPFLIAVFCIVTVNTTYNKIDVDISYIEWEYKDMHSFQISDGDYLLTAYGVNQRYYKVSGDDSLVWFVENSDGTEDPYAEIVEKTGASTATISRVNRSLGMDGAGGYDIVFSRMEDTATEQNNG